MCDAFLKCVAHGNIYFNTLSSPDLHRVSVQDMIAAIYKFDSNISRSAEQ